MDKNIFHHQLLICVMLSSCNIKYNRGRYVTETRALSKSGVVS